MATDLHRAAAMLLVALFLSVGCGSASGQAAQRSRTGQTASSAGGPSGIAGETVAIVCGGAASEQGCAHHPVSASIDVLRLPSRRHITTVHTDARGRFRLNAPPGRYELQAHTSGQAIWARVVTLRVSPHQIKHTMLTFGPRHPLPVAPGSVSG